MLETLITSKTRIKLLVRFFLNNDSSAHLRGLEEEFNESSNAVRLELNRFEKAGLLNTTKEGNKKIFHANTNHPLYKNIHELVFKHLGFDQIIKKIISKTGNLEIVFVTGEFAKGKDSDIIELVFVGDQIDKNYLPKLIEKTESFISRKIRYIIYTTHQFEAFQLKNKTNDMLLLWKA